MADPMSITASLLAVTTAAVQSTKSLYETVKSIEGGNKSLCRLQDELRDLINILDSLAQVTNAEHLMLTLLQGPIERCSQVCREFEQSMEVFRGKTKTGFRDWTKIEFMKGDINEFIDTIAGYKSTISISLGTITLAHTSKISNQVLQEYNEMIQDTAYNLDLHLRRIDEKMMQLNIENTNTSGESIDLEDEREVTKQRLRVCEDARSYIASVLDRESYLLPETLQNADEENSFEAQLRTRQVLDENRNDFAETIDYLRKRLDLLIQNDDPGNDNERARLQADINLSKHSVDILNTAREDSRQKALRLQDVTAEGDSNQIVVSTLADLFGINKVRSQERSASVLGLMTDEQLKDLWEKRLQMSRQAMKEDLGLRTNAADALHGQSSLPRVGSQDLYTSEQKSDIEVLVALREPPPSIYGPDYNPAGHGRSASVVDAFERRLTGDMPNAPVSVLAGTSQDSGYATLTLENAASSAPKSKETDDAASILSVTESVTAALSLAPNTKAALVDSFAALLTSELLTYLEGSNDDIGLLFGTMPTLLSNFSAELKTETSHSDVLLQRSTAAFVRLNRSDIIRSFKDSLSVQMDLLTATNASDAIRTNQDLPTVNEKIRLLWTSDPSGEPEAQDALDIDDELGAEMHENSIIPHLADARSLIEDSKAFRLLLEKAKAALNLTSLSGTVMEKVRSETYNALVVTGKQHSSRAKIEYYIAWDPAQFLLDQFEIPTEANLCNVITITGSGEEVQAATCLDYVRQVWPIAGEDLLLAVRDYVHNKLLSPSRSIPPLSVELSNSTRVEISHHGDYLCVKCDGLIHAVAEAAEELAWLGAACREHSATEQLGLCSVHVLSLNLVEPHIVITYSLKDLEQAAIHVNNTSCWHALFRNAVIAQGYPTRRRSQNEQGLEIPLQLMLELGLTDSVTMYNNGLVIDGLQSMFVPVDRSKDTIQWHYLYSEEDECMMFSRADEVCSNRLRSDRLDEHALGVARHFVGWTTHAEILFGSNKIAFANIKSSKLDPCGPGYVLEKASVSGGKFVTFGVTVGRGKKDESLHIDPGSWYRKMVGSAARTNVILYDAHDRQAWLTDGASTLLHLSRAQLSLDILEGVDLQRYRPPDPTLARNACQKALLDDSNRMLEVDREYIGTTEERTLINGVWETKTVVKHRTICFQDMVKDNWKILNQIFSLSKPPAGVELPTSIRKHIEGFDFVDIVYSAEEMIRRTLPLGAHGRAWLDFARAIHAITLFGTGFGQLVIPAAGSNRLCEHWSRVPKGLDYLVASVDHLEQLRELRSEGQESHHEPIELCRSIYWHRGHRLFEHCNGCTITQPCDRVQGLHTPIFGPKFNPGPMKDSLAGAVVFGKTACRHLWGSKDCSHTELLPLSQSQSEETDESILDNGIGTSIDGGLSLIAPSFTTSESTGVPSPGGRVAHQSIRTQESRPAADPRDQLAHRQSGQSKGAQPKGASDSWFEVPRKRRFRRYLRLPLR